MVDKVLVTGGAGFIGSHVARELVNAGNDVVVLDDLSGGFVENIPSGATFVHGSITDVAVVDGLFSSERFDHVYHMAAYAAEGLSHFIKRFNYENNLLGTVNLINAAVNSGVRTFVFTSSIAVYGSSPELPMTEKTQPRPEDPYGIAKLAVEQELQITHEMFGLDYVIFRPHNVYGEHQNIGDKYRNVVGIFMNQVLQGKPMTIFGDGEQQRAFSYIGDVAPIIASSSQVPAARNEIFNIGADQPYSVNELASEVALAMGVEPHMVHLPGRNEVTDAYARHEKLHSVFGSKQATDLGTGLSRMADWVKRHGPRESMEFEKIEIEKNLPVAWT